MQYELILYFQHSPARVLEFARTSYDAAEQHAADLALEYRCNNGWSLYRVGGSFARHHD